MTPTKEFFGDNNEPEFSVRSTDTAMPRMLIVDESCEDRAFIARLFENGGIDMDWATSGFSALKKLHTGYDLILTALSTEDMDGIELLIRIKQIDANVEVIAAGGDQSEETVARAMRHGAFCYLKKPFSNKDIVIRAVRRALDSRRETGREEVLYRSIILGKTDVVESDTGPHRISFAKTGFPAVDLLSLMNDGFVFLDANGKIDFANVRFSKKLSLPYRSLLNKQFVKYVLREDREAFVAFLGRIEESRVGIHEMRMVNRTGRIIHMMVTCRRFDMEDGGPKNLLVVTDITDKRMAEERARMLATFVDRAKFEAILVHNEESRIVYCNRAAEEMFGYKPNKLTGTSLDKLFRRDDKSDRITLVSTEPGDSSYELIGIQSDGSTFPVEVSESSDKGDDGADIGLIFARDITKRKRAETGLLSANERLTAINEELIFIREAQQRFFANMSHELKTPLNTISGYAGLMLEGIGGALSEKHQKWAESIKRQSNQLLVLIQEILEFAKAGSLESAVSAKSVRADALVQEIAAAAAALIGKKPIEIVTRIPESPPTVTTDPHRLRRVLTNLMSNAVKFTEKGTVTLGIEPLNPSSVEFFVADTGIGIPESELPKIFNDFYQISHPGADGLGGSGLGLAIVRRLVEQLGGAVHVESILNKGSKFTVVLPLKLSKSGQKATGRPSDPLEGAPGSISPASD